MENLLSQKNDFGKWTVYSLTCLATPNIIYIGITNEEYIIGRLFQHFYESVSSNRTKNEEKHSWVRNNWKDLKMNVIINNIDNENIARDHEAETVFYYIKQGYNVLNKTYTAIRVFDKYGNFYKDFASYASAAKEFGVETCRVIGSCTQKIRLLGKYYIEKYNPDITSIEVNTDNIPIDKDEIVLQCDSDGNVIKEWKNAYTVSKELNIDRSYLTKCLKNFNKKAKGFRFKYKNLSTSGNIIYKVFMYDSENNLVNKFINNKECAKYLINLGLSKSTVNIVASSISQSIKKNKKYLGYVFRKE